MNNPYIHRRREKMPTRQAFSMSRKDGYSNRTIATAQMGAPPLNKQFLESRRQNYLNTGYNIRKRKLQDITLKNQKIYVKLNSQKSVYSRDAMRKSYQSSMSISRRLSESKLSSRQGSRASMRSSQVHRKKTKQKVKQKYRIETNSISSIKESELSKLKAIFKIDVEVQNINPKALSKPRKQSLSSNQIANKDQVRLKLPPIKAQLKEKCPPKISLQSKKFSDGAFLHIIAEEMFGRSKN